MRGAAKPMRRSAESAERTACSTRAREELDRTAQARVQRRVRDAHFRAARVEADHEERVVRRDAGAARDEGGVAVELDARELDRALGLRGGDHGVPLTRE